MSQRDTGLIIGHLLQKNRNLIYFGEKESWVGLMDLMEVIIH